MAAQGYEEELRSERAYVADLYTRLDAERARVRGEYDAALGGKGLGAMERDVGVRALGREAKRLEVVDNGLCFGRMDAVAGERSYIGRIGLFDEEDDYRPVLLDWRAPHGTRVLHGHRREPGGHAPTPAVPHARAARARVHRRGARAPGRG